MDIHKEDSEWLKANKSSPDYPKIRDGDYNAVSITQCIGMMSGNAT